MYKLLKKFDFFHWTEETQKALDDLKALISKPPILASSEPSETLILYVMAQWSGRSPDMSTRYNGWSTTSARSSLTMKPATIRYKNNFTSS
jgi:hypothetical protein